MKSITVVCRARPSVLSAACGAFASVLVAGCSASSAPSVSSAEDEALAAVPEHATRAICPSALGATGYRCLGTFRTDLPEGFTPDVAPPADAGSPDAGPAQISYGPADLADAYAIAKGGAGTTVAVVNLNDDPSAEADLAFYRAKYGLPPCTTANGCFRKVNGAGTTGPLPKPNYHSAAEITLDLDAVSAGCPACNVLLVEADAEDPTAHEPFGSAVDTAARLGAKFISISYGEPEVSSTATFGIPKADALENERHYVHPGVAIFVSAGDAGFATSPDNAFDLEGPLFPSDIPEVFAVGGTRLARSTASARGWTEGVWGPGGLAGAGNSGCSAFFPKPSYQTSTACTGREVTDLSAVADPSTGLATYITYTNTDPASSDYIPKGWNVFGGTSLAAPLTAAIFAASGRIGVDPSFAYAHEADFHDVVHGSNGTCKEQSLCHARPGYDGPTGNGTPDGKLLGGS